MINFILALAVAVFSLSGVSLLWPRFTANPRPQVLESIHDVVRNTQIGSQAASVLGVSDEAAAQQIDVESVLAGAVGSLQSAVEARMQTVIMTQLTRELSEDQKQELRGLICEPTEPVNQ